MRVTTPPDRAMPASRTEDEFGLRRRSLLRLALGGSAIALAPMALAQTPAPKRGG